METTLISKPKFHKDLDVNLKADMLICAHVDFDLSLVNDHIKRMLSTMHRGNILKARKLVDDFIEAIERISDDN